MIYRELEHLKMCLDRATDINEIFNIVTGDSSDDDIYLGY